MAETTREQRMEIVSSVHMDTRNLDRIPAAIMRWINTGEDDEALVRIGARYLVRVEELLTRILATHTAAAADAAALESLLRRIVKYAREDRARTPGVTRLARALDEANALLADYRANPLPPAIDKRALYDAASRVEEPGPGESVAAGRPAPPAEGATSGEPAATAGEVRRG